MTWRKLILSVVVIAGMTAAPAWAQDAASPAKGADKNPAAAEPTAPKAAGKPALDLGDGLLDDLTGDLFEGLETEVQKGLKEKEAAPKPKPPEKPAQPDAPSPLDLPGEDIGQESNPILDIGRMMRYVEQRLAKQDAGAQTQAQQQQILDELARLIEQAQQPSQPDNASNQTPQMANRDQQDQQSQEQDSGSTRPQEQQGDGQTTGKRPAGQPLDSEEGVRESDIKQADPQTRSELIKSAWGHLPPHLREAMLNVPTGEYLPQYAPLIELYFKRLAEQYRQRP